MLTEHSEPNKLDGNYLYAVDFPCRNDHSVVCYLAIIESSYSNACNKAKKWASLNKTRVIAVRPLGMIADDLSVQICTYDSSLMPF